MARKVLRRGNRFAARVGRRYFSEGEKRRPEMRLLFAGYTRGVWSGTRDKALMTSGLEGRLGLSYFFVLTTLGVKP